MKLVTLIISALLAIGVTMADDTDVKHIDHDKVQPFPEPNPPQPDLKALITFKPMIHIKLGCHPFALVNAAGEVSAGLKAGDPQDGDCSDPPLGSQIYARSKAFDLVNVLVYMWFFPKSFYHRYYPRTVAVIITKPENGDPKILACSIQDASTRGYSFHHPCPAESLKGNSMKIMYDRFHKDDYSVTLTDEEGDFQPAAIWEEMPEAARISLNEWNILDEQLVTIHDKIIEDTVARCMTDAEYELITKDLSPPPSA